MDGEKVVTYLFSFIAGISVFTTAGRIHLGSRRRVVLGLGHRS
jgi:hypothetical protein